jgi:hypothetical protein
MAVENRRLIADLKAYRASSFADGHSQFTCVKASDTMPAP